MQLTLLAQCSGILVSGEAAVSGEGNSTHLIVLESKKQVSAVFRNSGSLGFVSEYVIRRAKQ
jgi:hypothetical protein